MDENEIRDYSTRDLAEAATLSVLGHDVIGIDLQVEGSKNLPVGYFRFVDSEKLQADRKDFVAGRCRVEPRTYSMVTRTLKSQCTNGYSNPRHANRMM